MENSFSNLKDLLANGQTEAALQLSLQIYQRHPDDAMANYYCAITYDISGQEHKAAPHYEHALGQGLEGEERRAALLGLGSTYRVLGEHHKSAAMLRQGLQDYTDGREFEVFLALTLYSLGDYAQAMALMLQNLAETTQDPALQDYKQALLHYSRNLD